MVPKSCFVIMPIGDQDLGSKTINSDELKQRYDDLIKEAIQKADPSLEVVRADEVSLPGSITSDILTRIMHSDIVVADVTYPNPNVFYELGLRHACRIGTIIIRDKNGPTIPFDIAHLRHIEYENTPTGLKVLAEKLRSYLDHFERKTEQPDNHFLELAKLTSYKFPDYGKDEYTEEDAKIELFTSLLQLPEFLDLLSRQSKGEEVDQSEIMRVLFANPEIASTVVTALVKAEAMPNSKTKEKKKSTKGKRVSKKKK